MNARGSAGHLLLLGGGPAQVPLLRRAQAAGFFVTVADIDSAAPAVATADGFERVSTFDAPGVAAAAKRIGCSAVCTIGSDQPVYAAAYASAAAGLAYPLSPETALRVTNKQAMKSALAAAGVPTVPFVFWDGVSVAQPAAVLRPPYVLKPLDSQGQRGVALVDSPAMAERQFARTLAFSRQPLVLVEEYYPSDEVTVSGWVHGGEVTIFAVTDRITVPVTPCADHPVALGICLAHRFPSQYAGGHESTIDTVVARAIAALGVGEGPIYCQLLIGDAGVVVNEIACRLGGAYEDQSIPAACGVDIIDLQLQICRGENPRPPRPGAKGCFSVPLCFCRAGTIAALSGGEAVRAVPSVVDFQFLQPVGTAIRALDNSTQRAAFAVIHATEPAVVDAAVDTLFDTALILDRAGQQLLLDTREFCRHRPTGGAR